MTTEQQQLITKAKNSIKAAQLLAEEGLYDFSVSRASILRTVLKNEKKSYSSYKVQVLNQNTK